ncbi:hypothetical protein HPIN_08015 [Helicobacter pylori India7]|uniref:Uncharacterized protein n=1 Tax=Helicobacter pylori (strain India7) TaxID=907238 RepID=E8QEU0_HELP7|nr:hypothetical protein HPIN_08015 [Helicobacter pylori India7]
MPLLLRLKKWVLALGESSNIPNKAGNYMEKDKYQ